jgi:hypothetical protein
MDRFDFIAYMRDCAVRLKGFGHSDSQQRFFRITGLTQLEELLFNLPDASFPALMVENNQNGTLTDRSPSDNYVDIPYYSFMVAAKADFNDHDQIEAAKVLCKSLGLKIISRMVHDKRRMAVGLTFLNVSGIAYNTFGPVADKIYGVSFSFTVPDLAEINYDPLHWKSL